jgi:ribokinase
MPKGVKIAVVGHLEWVHFLPVAAVPVQGELIEAHDAWEDAAGGGAVAAVQMLKLAGSAVFFTAVGDDALGREAVLRLEKHGLEMAAAVRRAPQRLAYTFLDDDGERTITVAGERLIPRASDPLPWDRIDEMDAVYFTGGDADALRAARRARVLVATPRARDALTASGVELDVLVRSGGDAGESDDPDKLGWRTRHVVTTRGEQGGSYTAEGRTGQFHAAPLPGPIVDAYGAGDSFAAALTYGLGVGLGIEEAIEVASRCGAANITGRGPYAGQLTADGLAARSRE